ENTKSRDDDDDHQQQENDDNISIADGEDIPEEYLN
ncbi:unnamed protein product, partial [Rotaria magnacalcarata]